MSELRKGPVPVENTGHAITARTISMSATVPGSGEHCIDDRALRILCAHEENVL